jgi:hypothetical protein
MESKRRRRSIQDRIADQERELEELRWLERIENLEQALKGGRVSSDNRAEFTARIREMKLIKRAAAAVERHDEPELADALKVFQNKVAESMATLVQEEAPSEQ